MQFEEARYYVSKDAAARGKRQRLTCADAASKSIHHDSRSGHACRIDRPRLALSASVGFPMHPRSRKRDTIFEPLVAEMKALGWFGSVPACDSRVDNAAKSSPHSEQRQFDRLL